VWMRPSLTKELGRGTQVINADEQMWEFLRKFSLPRGKGGQNSAGAGEAPPLPGRMGSGRGRAVFMMD